MKVELKDTSFGPSLVMSYAEFLKANRNEQEFISLCTAVDAYLQQMDLNYKFDKDEYNRILRFLEEGANVIFHSLYLQYPERHECLISVIQHNELIHIRKQLNRGDVFTCVKVMTMKELNK
jgi:hypothetical protein